ncbi:MAG: hypothetical protein MK209_08435, partial [Planctomycetes bacterium]|nr:hypothetical protein [Planctomycetota bacterium]
RGVELAQPAQHVRADRVYLRVAREAYYEALQGSRLMGDIGNELVGKRDSTAKSPTILEIRLQGNVELVRIDGTMRCAWAVHQPLRGSATFYDVEVTMRGDLGPEGWPWRLRAATLQEFADGSLRAKRAQLTACDLDEPAYALAMLQLDGTPDGEGDYVWSPSAPWVEINGRRILPMPTFDFRTGKEDGGFGLRNVRVSSGRQLGTAVELGFASSVPWNKGKLDWRLFPSFSTRRGFPLRTTLNYARPGYIGDWDLFVLEDNSTDVTVLRNRIQRDNSLRWRLRLDNRFDLSELWRLDADLALTSDPIVDPEFFREEWRDEDDALSEIYLRRQTQGDHFSARAAVRLDDTGFTPLGAFGPNGGLQPQQLDLLPRIEYHSFARTIGKINSGALGGRDRKSPVQLQWGADAGRFDLRSLNVAASLGRPDFVTRPDQVRDRLRAWAELDTQLLFGQGVLRPGLRAEFGAVHNASGSGGDTQSSLEAFVEASIAIERKYDGGWKHRVRPMVRLRHLHMFDEASSDWYPFELFDRRRPGQAVEFSLRQFWYGSRAHNPWLDVEVLVPYYPNVDEPLLSETFPGVRSGQDVRPWGPTEFRGTWSPGVRGGVLRGIRATSNLRYRWDTDAIEEWYGLLSLAPQTNWRLSINRRLLNQPEAPDAAFKSVGFSADWRINESFELRGGRTFSARGNSTTSTRYGLVYYGHGFAFEFYTARNDFTGESRYGVNIVPCFLVERFRNEPDFIEFADRLQY